MARLTREVLNEGRRYVLAHDLDGLLNWVRSHKIPIHRGRVREVFSEYFEAGKTKSALRVFNAAFATVNPALEWTKRIVALFITLGSLGLLISLLRSCG